MLAAERVQHNSLHILASCRRGMARLRHEASDADARTLQAQTQAPVGVLQLPRTRSERFHHLRVLDRVPFDLVPAFDERWELHGGGEASKGSIGRILRRYRKDSTTVLLNTMLQACAQRCRDLTIWDSAASNLRDIAAEMSAPDLGLTLACLVKTNYRRDAGLVPLLLGHLADRSGPARNAVAAPRRPVLSVPGSHGRRHRRLVGSAPLPIAIAPVSMARSRRTMFSEHALASGLAAAQHFRLGRKCPAPVSKLCNIARRSHRAISARVLSRVVHSVGGLAEARNGASARLLDDLQPKLVDRLGVVEGSGKTKRREEEWAAGDLCLVARAYALSACKSRRPLFDALRERLTDVVLLQLSPSEVAGLANSFSKLTVASELGHVPLFDLLGRQLIAAGEASGLRNACVALNAFAQASIRHEPLFVGYESLLPAWMPDRDCDMRQLSMLAHAYVRVGLPQTSLLPLIWSHATRLVPTSNGQSLALVVFAATKASAIATPDGALLLRAISLRLFDLLGVSQSGGPSVDPETVTVIAYALIRGGCAHAVAPGLWPAFAERGRLGLAELSASHAANLATALVELPHAAPKAAKMAQSQTEAFFDGLRERLAEETKVEPLIAAKLVSAFGDARALAAGPLVQRLAHQALRGDTAGGSPLGFLAMRRMAESLSRLRVPDEDLLQALTVAQRPQPRRRR